MTAIHPEFEQVGAPGRDPNRVGHGHGHGAWGHGDGGPAPHRIVVGYGFWIFLLSDIVMFSCFFAAYAVLHNATVFGSNSWRAVGPPSVALCSTA